MEPNNDLLYGERVRDIGSGLLRVYPFLEIDFPEIGGGPFFRLRRPLMLWDFDCWALGRAMHSAEADLPTGIRTFVPPQDPGVHILSQRQFDSLLKVHAAFFARVLPVLQCELGIPLAG